MTTEERDLLASLVESSNEAIVGLTTAGNILTWNRGAEQLFGYSPGEVLGKPFSLLFASETQAVKNDGTRIDVVVSVSPMPAGSSAWIRQERQTEKVESMGRVAGAIAHDFNNFLTVINGYSGLILSRLEPHDRLYREVNQIVQGGKEATALTRQLLAFSGKQVLHPKAMDLSQLVASARGDLARLTGDKVELQLELSDTPASIKADPAQIRQILLNLTSNARDAMPEGGKLIVRTSQTETHVMLDVRDTGLGMSPEAQQRLFEPFFTTKRRSGAEGVGLGLATAYGIVRQSGGSIRVSSEVNRGTSVEIVFPKLS